MENGTNVQFRFTNTDNDTWQDAVFCSESRLHYELLEDDGHVYSHLKDRIEIRVGVLN